MQILFAGHLYTMLSLCLPFLFLFFYNSVMKTFHYLISGRVQGVAFRHCAVREAERLGISGTVRNQDDGSVEVFAQGDEAEINQFESFLRTGPRSAQVDRVNKEVIDDQMVYRGFDISW
jgi:acylphosphatase